MALICLRRQQGLSLIELMTVVLMLGLLLGVAWPSYQGHLRRADRVQAQAVLLEAQHFMERYYSAHGRYTTATGGVPDLPARLQRVPSEGEPRYRIRLESVELASFRLRADPAGSMEGDACGSLTLANTGAKGRTGPGLTVQQCWR